MSLLSGLRRALEALREAGCETAYIDGSFVSANEAPNDWDGCWEHSTVDWTRLDPVLLDDRDFRAAQKAKYGGEMFPVSIRFRDTDMLEVFQYDRRHRHKGIVALDLTKLPRLRRRRR